MYVVGINLGPSEAWLLAQKLQQAGHGELAAEVGSAVDAKCSELFLTSGEHAILLLTLERDCPPVLLRLRDALWMRATGRRSA